MAQIIKWCKYCYNVLSVEHDSEIAENKNVYASICKACEKKSFGKKHETENENIVNND